MRITRYNVVTYCVLALITNVASNDKLSQDLCFDELTPLPMRCIPVGGYSHFTCERYFDDHHNDRKRKVQVNLSRIKMIFDTDDFIVLPCLGIVTMSGIVEESSVIIANYDLTFNSSLSIGRVIFSRSCFENSTFPGPCEFEIALLSEVLALPQFTYSPDMPEFWNFSSSFFQAEQYFLLDMSLEGFVNKTYPFVVPSLSGCSLRSISINGYFGADKRGPIPIFDHLPNLESLNISNSGREDIPAEDTTGSQGTAYFISASNEFRGIPTGISRRWPTLSHNLLTMWSHDPDSTKNNNFSVKSHDMKKIMPWIQTLNISRNPVIFSKEMLLSLNVLKTVDLGGIYTDCTDCKIKLFRRWLSYTTISIEVLGTRDTVSCSFPDYLKGQPVKNVDIDRMCTVPKRKFWLVLCSILSIVAISALLLGGAAYYYRTEVIYLLHLAKVRATSRRKEDSQTDCIYDAFVCYSGRNRKWVLRRLAMLLERRPERYRLCFFDRDFRLGSHIVTNIVEAIDRSRKVVVVLTEKFVQSKWCQWELEMANHKMFSEDREFLVLLQLEPLGRDSLPRLLRFLLDTRPVVRWPRPETTSTVQAAAAQLRRALGPSLWQRSGHAAPSPSGSQTLLVVPDDEEQSTH